MKSSIYTAAVALGGILLGLDARTVNSEEKTGKWSPPSLESLPSTPALPELFRLASGERVTSREDWDRRRDELKAMMLYYQYGSMPPRPDLVTAEDVKRKPHRSGKGTEEWLTLRIGSRRALTMRALLYVPEGDGPFPVVIREEGTLGRTREVPSTKRPSHFG